MSCMMLLGEEPYLIDRTIKNAQSKASPHAIVQTDNPATAIEEIRTYSFFGRKCVTYTGPLKDIDLEEVHTFIEDTEEKTILLIRPEKEDKKLKISKILDKLGLIGRYNRKDYNGLKSFIITYMKSYYNKELSNDALTLFIERIAYLKSNDITLYNVSSDLDKLAMLESTSIDVDSVTLYSDVNEIDNIYSLMKHIRGKRADLLIKESGLLIQNKKKAIGTLSLLLREYRLLYLNDKLKANKSELGVPFIPSSFGKTDTADKSLEAINRYITGLKIGMYTDEQAQKMCLLKLYNIANG